MGLGNPKWFIRKLQQGLKTFAFLDILRVVTRIISAIFLVMRFAPAPSAAQRGIGFDMFRSGPAWLNEFHFLFLLFVHHVISESVNELLHILRQVDFPAHEFIADRMNKSQCKSMQCLSLELP